MKWFICGFLSLVPFFRVNNRLSVYLMHEITKAATMQLKLQFIVRGNSTIYCDAILLFTREKTPPSHGSQTVAHDFQTWGRIKNYVTVCHGVPRCATVCHGVRGNFSTDNVSSTHGVPRGDKKTLVKFKSMTQRDNFSPVVQFLPVVHRGRHRSPYNPWKMPRNYKELSPSPVYG